jgi:TetR/AcrR family transcriptional repressor of mexJK operon
MPSPAPVNDPDLKTRRLIDVARLLFVAKGYAATSMDEVASVARMSKTTLYTRYPSKAELFAAVIAAHGDSSGMNFDPAELASLPVAEALCTIAERFVEFTCQPEAVRLQLVYESEGSQLPEVVAAFERSGPERDITMVEGYLAAKVGLGELALEDPRFAAGYFLNAVKGTPSGASLSPYAGLAPAQRRAHIRRIVALFRDGAGRRDQA